MSSSSSQKFSSITITKNEGEYIEDCLKSISWCDEHIVIDEYSGDDTVEIAESFGAQVIQMHTPESANTFDILREIAVEEASHPWIVRIDADERSHKSLNRTLQEIVASGYPDVVYAPRMNFIGDEWFTAGSRWWPDCQPVLFHRDYMDFQDRIHTFMSPPDDASVVFLPSNQAHALRHYSYTSIIDLMRRRWRWGKIESEVTSYSILTLIYAMVSDFAESYIVDGGCTDGKLGLKVALIDSIYHVVVAFYN